MENKEDKSFKKKITVEIDKDLHRLLKILSYTDSTTIRELIDSALRDAYVNIKK